MSSKIIDKQEISLNGIRYLAYIKEVPVKSARDGHTNSATKAFIKKL